MTLHRISSESILKKSRNQLQLQSVLAMTFGNTQGIACRPPFMLSSWAKRSPLNKLNLLWLTLGEDLDSSPSRIFPMVITLLNVNLLKCRIDSCGMGRGLWPVGSSNSLLGRRASSPLLSNFPLLRFGFKSTICPSSYEGGREILELVASQFGCVLKVDEHTLKCSRAKFTRVCIEINLEQPLQ